MKIFCILLSILFSINLSICKAHTSSFEWAIGNFAGQSNVPIAMLTSIFIDEKSCDMQIDTGMNNPIAWHEYTATREEPQLVTVKFGPLKVQTYASKAVRSSIANCQQGIPIGSLGNGFFENGTLSLDIKKQRISYTPNSSLPATKNTQPFVYQKYETLGGHILVETTFNGKNAYAILDTGSTALHVGVFSRKQWASLTGYFNQSDELTRAFEIHAWGKQHRCFIAPATVPTEVGSMQMVNPFITYCPTIGTGFSSNIIGVIGMKAFENKLIVIDYPSQRWQVSTSD